jgi:hypothetical protein
MGNTTGCLAHPCHSHTVAQKIVPMFTYFSKISSVWNADIIQGFKIYVQQTTSSWLSNKPWCWNYCKLFEAGITPSLFGT